MEPTDSLPPVGPAWSEAMAAEFEKVFTVRHYQDLAGQAQVDRRQSGRRSDDRNPHTGHAKACECVQCTPGACHCNPELHFVCSEHWTGQ